jgi:hypothetical protein
MHPLEGDPIDDTGRGLSTTDGAPAFARLYIALLRSATGKESGISFHRPEIFERDGGNI